MKTYFYTKISGVILLSLLGALIYGSGSPSRISTSSNLLTNCTNGWSSLPNSITNGFGVASDIWIKKGGAIDTPYYCIWGGNTTGFQPGGTGIIRLFNTITLSWTELPDPFNQGLYIGGGAIVGDTMYVGGGVDILDNYSTNWMAVNLRTNQRSMRSPVPYGMGWFQCLGLRDRYVFTCGGYTGYFFIRNIYMYDTYTNIWAQGTIGLNNNSLSPSVGLFGDSLIVIVGGSNSTTTATTIYKGIMNATDPHIITWSQASVSLPYSSGIYKSYTGYPSHGMKGSWMYILSGCTAPNFQVPIANCWRYNPYTDVFETLPNRLVGGSWNSGNGYLRINDNQVEIFTGNGQHNGIYPPYADHEVLCYSDDIVGIANNSNNIPAFYELKQNYPNPFNPVTEIVYSIPFGLSQVVLKVYDILGNEAATLVNQQQTAGEYRVTFDGSNLSGGVYFYKLSALGGSGGFSETKKMILIK